MNNVAYASSKAAETSSPAKEAQELPCESTADGTRSLCDAVTVRLLRRDEVIAARQMLADERLNGPSLAFDYALYDAYPGGWLCAIIGDSIVGITFFARFPDGSGCAGSFHVKKEYRKQGVGCHLRDALAVHFPDANLGINCTEHRANSYARSGYRIRSFGIRVFGGEVNVVAAAAQLAILRRHNPLKTSSGDAITISEVTMPSAELLRYDAEVNVTPRDALVTLYTALPESYTLAVVRHDGTVVGYGTLHRGEPNYIVAPLYADDEQVAELILMSLVERLKPGDSMYWGTPAMNTAAVSFAERLGQRPVVDLVRLYTRYDVPVPLRKVYSLATCNASFA